jgi:hypothetical protein
LTHGYSRVVLALLKLAAAEGKDFNVICTGIWSVLVLDILNSKVLGTFQHDIVPFIQVVLE